MSIDLVSRLRGAIPKGLLGMLVLIVMAEGYVTRHQDLYFSGIWASGWKSSRALSRRSESAEILCVGDSLVKFNVIPRLVEDRLGLQTVNLGLCTGQPPATYHMLRNALQAGARPRAVVVDFTEHLLSSGPRKCLRLWPEALGPLECAGLAWTARDRDLLLELVLAKLLPTVKDRFELRAGLLAALQGRSANDSAGLPTYWRNWNRNSGAQLNPAHAQTASPEVWFDHVYPKRWECDPVNALYIERFLDLAEARGISVFWLLPPYLAEFQTICERNGVDGRFSRFVQGVQARHPDLVVIDGRHSPYPTDAYTGDPIHLTARGATTYTDEVAGIIGRVLGEGPPATRWVSLPPYREPPEIAGLEDLDASLSLIRR